MSFVTFRGEGNAGRAQARLVEILDRSTQYATTDGPFPDRLPIVAITGKLLIGQYEAVIRWAQWAADSDQ